MIIEYNSTPPLLLILGGMTLSATGLGGIARIALFTYGTESNPVLLLLTLILLVVWGLATIGVGVARIESRRIQRRLLANVLEGSCLACGYPMVGQIRCSECGVARDYSFEALGRHPLLMRSALDASFFWGGVAALMAVVLKITLEELSIIIPTGLAPAYLGTLLGALLVGIGWERRRFGRATALWLAATARTIAPDKGETGLHSGRIE